MRKVTILKLGSILGLLISVLFIGGCTPVAAEDGGGFDWVFIAMMVGIFAFSYFLMIRPQQKKQKAHKQMVEELKRGDRVITAGGIYGQVESVSDESITIKVESGAIIRVAKNSVTLKQAK